MNKPQSALRRQTREALAFGWVIPALLATACSGPLIESDDRPVLHEIMLEAPYAEAAGEALFGPERVVHQDLLERLADLTEDDKAKGLLLRVGGMGGAWARVAEMGDAVALLREAGKPVHCHFETTDNLGYMFMAQSCDRISATPAGLLNLIGLSAQVVYARELMETVGLSAELLQVGRFKGAADALTLSDMPEETRESLNAVLDHLQGRLNATLIEKRAVPQEQVQGVFDRGPYTSHQAKLGGLIDDVGYDDEARHHAKEAAGAERVVVTSPVPKREQPSLGELLAILLGEKELGPPSDDHLVVARMVGTIMSGGANSERGADASAFVREMRRLADQEEVKAVVLRIDSPGGSALASDRMWHAVRRLAARKPVVVSVGEMAASGGYYVASAGTHILAHDDSMIGSIGVVGGKIVGEELAARLGLHAVSLSRGKNANWGSPLRRFSDTERMSIQALLNSTYRLFLKRVAAGRGVEVEKVLPMAEGRLMTGKEARQGGLVDGVGGILAAIALARDKGGLADDAPILRWPARRNFIEQLGQSVGGSNSRTLKEALFAHLPPHSGALFEALADSPRGVAAVHPFGLVVQ